MNIRNVRNFWVDVSVPGRKSSMASGPKDKGDGMYIELYQRVKGISVLAYVIRCKTCGERLKIDVNRCDESGNEHTIDSFLSER